jgi:hypothetical protein
MLSEKKPFKNPFRPGAGHMPPFLAGRDAEKEEFVRLLSQEVVLANLVLTGLRGVGKTVLLDTFKPTAMSEGWLWVGTDLSESMSLSEDNISTRLLTDLSVVTSQLVIDRKVQNSIGFVNQPQLVETTMSFGTLAEIYKSTPGLAADKLKRTLNVVWQVLQHSGAKGLVFAYDEAQNLEDHAGKDQFPLSLLLDLFQSIQKQNIPFLLLLAGLPTLLPKLVQARTFSERMFHVVTLDRLGPLDCKAAILEPIQKESCPVTFNAASVETITKISGGYPYFIQFICREVYDVFIQQHVEGMKASVPVDEIVRKLDTDFFFGRWAKATDRQRELLELIATLDTSDSEFTVQEIVAASKSASLRAMSGSSVNQMLGSLTDAGLVFKNRHGKYSFAVPLLSSFIKRQSSQATL